MVVSLYKIGKYRSTERLGGFSKIAQPRNKMRTRHKIALFLFLHAFDKPFLLTVSVPYSQSDDGFQKPG